MTWHLEPIMLSGRRYTLGKSFECRDPYVTNVLVQLMGKVAYASLMLNDDSQGNLSKEDIEELGAKLRAEYGVEVIHAERRAKPRQYETSAAPLT